MPVSWQIAPSPFAARSMFCAMIVSACAERVPGDLRRARLAHGRSHVWRQIGRGLHDEIQDRVEQGGWHASSIILREAPLAAACRHDSPHRARSAGREARPRRRVLRHPDRARARELSHQRLARPCRARHGHGPDQEMRGPRQHGARPAGPATSAMPSSRPPTRFIAGKLRDQFVVDVYQAGAGTSHNMNANEVLANRAAELLDGPRGAYDACASQRPRQHGPVHERRLSGGDATGAAGQLIDRLVATRRAAGGGARREVADAFADVLKVGRTHLQDAVPITLGQEFSGYAAVHRPRRRRRRAGGDAAAGAESRRDGRRHRAERRRRLHDRLAIEFLAEETGRPVVPAANRFRVTQSMGDVLAVSGAVRRLWRSRRARSPATCGCSRWGLARVSRRSGCRRCSPARRSCRAK